ncbi:MAG: SurA N-terminal domain-containing protein [Pseudomonas sp.]|nr:SurA N-terminal domain-containing protein [Pseudomonas sp.]
MLQKLRDKTSGWIATVILGLLIIPFAFFGMQDYLVQRSDMHVARVEAPPAWWSTAPSWWPVSILWEHEDVTIEEFRTAFEQERQRQRAEQGEAFDPRQFEAVDSKRAVLETLIDQRVQRLAAKRAGMIVSDQMVMQTIQGIPAFQVDGKFDPERYRLALAAQNQPASQFEQLVRDGLQSSLIAAGVGGSQFATVSEVDRVLRLLGEQRDVSLLVAPALPADTGAVSAAEIDAWYKANPADYRSPESVDIEYVELMASTMPEPPPADEAALRQRFAQEQAKFAAAEQRRASHILVSVPAGADAAATTAAQRKAEQLAGQARAPGADFAALAAANSDDAGSKSVGGDLGWIQKDMMPKPFEDALFAMQAGEVRGPVRTDSGWHVIRLQEIKAGQQGTFEEAREALAREQLDADRDRAFNELSTRLVDLVYKNPSALAPAARQVNLPVQTLGPITRTGGEGLAANPAVKRAAFSEALIQDGTVSDPIEIAPGHIVLIRVTRHAPEATRPLAQVRDAVIAAVRADRTRKAAQQRGDALLARVRAGETLEAIAIAEQLPPPDNIPSVPRGAPIPTPEVSEAMFAAAPPAGGKPSAGRVVLDDGRIAVFVLNKVTPGDVASAPVERRVGLQQQLSMLGGNDDVEALVKALRRGMKVSVVEANL